MEVSNVIYIYLLPVSKGMKSANSARVGIKYEIEASKEIKNEM